MRFADPVEQASYLAEQAREREVEAARRVETRPSRHYCDTCEDAIPERRREAIPGCQKCVHCQERVDVFNKHRRG